VDTRSPSVKGKLPDLQCPLETSLDNEACHLLEFPHH
jgi:hypothetical protein